MGHKTRSKKRVRGRQKVFAVIDERQPFIESRTLPLDLLECWKKVHRDLHDEGWASSCQSGDVFTLQSAILYANGVPIGKFGELFLYGPALKKAAEESGKHMGSSHL